MSDLYEKAREGEKYLKRLNKNLKDISMQLPEWIKILDELYYKEKIITDKYKEKDIKSYSAKKYRESE